MYPIYYHNWRNISTIYVYITRLALNEIFSPSNKIHGEVGTAKDLSAPPVEVKLFSFFSRYIVFKILHVLMTVGGRISSHYITYHAKRFVTSHCLIRAALWRYFGNTFINESMKEFHILGLRSGDLGGCNSGSTVRWVTWWKCVTKRKGDLRCGTWYSYCRGSVGFHLEYKVPIACSTTFVGPFWSKSNLNWKLAA